MGAPSVMSWIDWVWAGGERPDVASPLIFLEIPYAVGLFSPAGRLCGCLLSIPSWWKIFGFCGGGISREGTCCDEAAIALRDGSSWSKECAAAEWFAERFLNSLSVLFADILRRIDRLRPPPAPA